MTPRRLTRMSRRRRHWLNLRPRAALALALTLYVTSGEDRSQHHADTLQSPNGEMTASGHQNGSVYIFNNTTRKLAHSLSGLVKPVRAVAFSPANKYLAAAGDASVIAIYDTTSGEQVANLTGHASWIMSLSWNWSGEYLLSGCVKS